MILLPRESEENIKVQSSYIPEKRKVKNPFQWQYGYIPAKIKEIRLG